MNADKIYKFICTWRKVILFGIIFYTLLFVCFSKVISQSKVKGAFIWLTNEDEWYIPSLYTVWTGACVSGFIADGLRDVAPNDLRYVGKQDQWHGYRDGNRIGTAWSSLIIARRIYDGMTWKEFGKTLVVMGGIRHLTRAFFKTNKGGFKVYNSPRYNKHAIVYPQISINPFSLRDGYISTGKWTTPLLDLAVAGLIVLIK